LTSLRNLLLVSTILVLAGTAWSALLSGTVTDGPGGPPLEGITVTATSVTDRSISAMARTDLEGRYTLTNLASGQYEVVFSDPEFQSFTEIVELIIDDERRLDIGLVPAAITLEEFVVTGQASDIESDLQTGYMSLDAGTLEAVPSVIEPDPIRALQSLPGVQAASDISSGLYIRGGGPDQTMVLMDGVTVYNPTHAFGFFSTFNNDAVRGVDLYKGAYPAAYGGRLGAVLDVSMREPMSDKVRGKVGISLIAARGLLEGKLGKDHWLISGRRSYLEPLLDAIRTPEDPIPSYYFYDVNATYLTERLGGVTSLTFYHGNDDIAVDADVNTAFNIGWGNTVAALRHSRFLSDEVEGRLTLSNSHYKSTTDAEILATGFDVDNQLNDITLAAVVDWFASPAHHLTFGLGHSWYEFTYRQEFNLNTTVDYASRPAELAAFAEDRWFLDDWTTLRTGLRARFISDGDRQLLEPRLALSRAVRPDLRLKFGAGLYNQYLQMVGTEGFSAGDFYLPIDETADLGRSWQSVLGAAWNINPQDLLSVELYATGLDDLVEFDNQAALEQSSLTADDIFVTDGKGYARGAEIFLQRKTDRFIGWLGYTLGWTNRNFDELNGGNDFVPKYDRRHDINAVASWQAGSWRLAASFRYATGQAFTPASARYQVRDPGSGDILDNGQILPADRNSARLLPYHRLDISARRPFRLFGKPAELVLEIFNLYNRRNEWFVQYNTEDEVTEATVVRMLPLIPSVGVNLEF